MDLATLHPDQPVALTLNPTLVSVLPCRVAAGFPSPAQDHAIQRLDLMAQLIKHPQATFLLRVRGESMKDAGVFDNDVVLADRASAGLAGDRRQWHMKQELRRPGYTTDWDGLALVRA